MSIVSLITGKKAKPNTQVYDLLDRVMARFVEGQYSDATKCIVILECPSEVGKTAVKYETCGVMLNDSLALLETVKYNLLKDS